MSEEQLAEDMVAGLLGEMLRRTETVRRVSVSVVDSLDQIPALADWLGDQASDPRQRAHWLGTGLRVALYLGDRSARLSRHRGRAAAAARAPGRATSRTTRSTASSGCSCILVVDLLPIVAFMLGVGIVAMLATVSPLSVSAETRAVARPVIQAVVFARVSVALARLLLVPESGALAPAAAVGRGRPRDASAGPGASR